MLFIIFFQKIRGQFVAKFYIILSIMFDCKLNFIFISCNIMELQERGEVHMHNCSALDCANYLIFLMNDNCDDLSNMKLNKLLYFAQGYSLRDNNKPLFNDAVEAWKHGPVINSVYYEYADSGNHIYDYDSTRINNLNDEDKELLYKIALNYGKYTASYLRNMTHRPNTPWDQIFDENTKHKEIPLSLIKSYFDKLSDLSSGEVEYADEDFIGYRDDKGHLVLPADWDDE